MHRSRHLVFGLSLLFAATRASHAQTSNSGVTPADPALEGVIRNFQADSTGITRFYDLPWSGVRFERLEKLYQDWQQQLSAVSFDPLKQQGRIDFLLLRNRLGADLDQLTLERRRLAEMEEVLAWR